MPQSSPIHTNPKHANEEPWYILGVGAIGGLWASQLQRWQVPVYLLLKDRHQQISIEQKGLRLDSPSHKHKHHHPFPTLVAPTPNHKANAKPQRRQIKQLLICTKANVTLEAVKTWSHMFATNISIILLQNGMGNAQALQTLLPTAKIYCAITTDGVWRKATNHLVWAGKGVTLIGSFSLHVEPKTPPPTIAQWLQLSESHKDDLQVHWHQDILTPVWHKLAINSAINGLTAIYHIQNGELTQHPQARPRLEQLCTEAEDVMSRCHIPPISHGLLNQVLRVLAQTANNKSSMLQDIEAHKPTEIEAINGYIIRQGSAFYLPCAGHRQVCQDVAALIHISPSNVIGPKHK